MGATAFGRFNCPQYTYPSWQSPPAPQSLWNPTVDPTADDGYNFQRTVQIWQQWMESALTVTPPQSCRISLDIFPLIGGLVESNGRACVALAFCCFPRYGSWSISHANVADIIRGCDTRIRRRACGRLRRKQCAYVVHS